MSQHDETSLLAHADQELARIRADVAEKGLVVVSVAGGGFSYTVGLTVRKQPELVVSSTNDLAVYFLAKLGRPLGLLDDSKIMPGSLHWRHAPTNTQHVYTTRPWSVLAGDDPLGVVIAFYGPHSALHVDHLSCPCDLCAKKVVVNPTGEYLRDA